MISIKNLTVQFGTFTAVDTISLETRPGEIYGFLGPNGAGKTTTIRVLTGQIRLTSGKVTIAGMDLQGSFEAIKPLFGYIPDFDNHFEELTASQNLTFFARLYRVPLIRVDEVLKKVELTEEQGQKVRNFSKGMKKKLVIAREILHNPLILYLDEPTANLDVHSSDVIRQLLRRLRDQGTTVFCTTHNMDEAEEICDRVAILDRGRIVDIDTPANFKSKHAAQVLHVVFSRDGGQESLRLSMDREGDREMLAEKIRAGEVLSIHSGEFNFKEVFLKLTGREFN
jgi:ABC-2 type transport system ATP-binding protein